MVDMTEKFLDAKKLFQNMFETSKELLQKGKVKPKKNQGRLLWNSSEKGTYIKKIHGELK